MLIAPETRLGIAVSGGADSVALLHMAAIRYPGCVAAATVDHRLRPEAADEAAMVAGMCATLGVPHVVLHPAAPISGSVQAAARAARYALLEQWRVEEGLDWLLTAHHADDQLETLLMRVRRASGLSGLACIRARHGHVLRPLLGVRRATLRAYCRAHQLPFVDDPSNADPDFDRARLREALAQAAQGPLAAWLDPVAASQSAAHLAEAGAALHWVADWLAREHLSASPGGVTLWTGHLPPDLPMALQRRLIVLALMAAGSARAPRGAALDHFIAQLAAGKKAMLGDIVAEPSNGIVRFVKAPPRRPVAQSET